MKNFKIQLDALYLEAETEAEAIDQAIEYFKQVNHIAKHEITEVE